MKSPPINLRIFAVATAILLCGNPAAQIIGQTNQNSPQAFKGYLIEVSNDWATSDCGYQPVRVTITSRAMSAASNDERFTVTIVSSEYRGPGSRTSAPLILPAGKKSAYVDLYVTPSNSYRTELFVEAGIGDGRYQQGSDLLQTTFQRTGQNQWDSHSVMLVSSTLTGRESRQWQTVNGKTSSLGGKQLGSGDETPNCGELLSVLDVQNIQPQFTQGYSLDWPAASRMHNSIHGCRPIDLPDSWIGLTSTDTILISLADLESINAEHPVKRRSLQKWAAAGGRLAVFEVGELDKNIQRIVPLINGNVNDEQVSKSQWSPLTNFRVAEYGNGRLVAIDDKMQLWNSGDFRALINFNLTNNDKALRQKIGARNFEDAIGGFRVPGVGEPPVVAFQFLIGLFVVVAGPVMYIVLRRTRRMQLLFVLVPMLSLAACVGLLSYAILVDGFETWGNVQSVTFLDQRTNSAVSHARTAYYSGSSPGPYEYDTDTLAVIPTDELNRELVSFQTSEKQTFSGANFRARTPHQMLTIRSYQSEQEIQWQTEQNSGENSDDEDSNEATNSVRVRNRLGGTIVYAVANIDSKLFAIKNLTDGKTGLAVVEELPRVNADVGRLMPELPSESDYNYRYSGSYFSSNYGNIAPNRGEESHFLTVISRNGLGGATSLLEEPNTYVAIVEETPEMQNQIEPANYKQQLHVIIGKW